MADWNPGATVSQPDKDKYVVVVRVQLDRDGRLSAPQQVVSRGFGRFYLVFDCGWADLCRGVYISEPIMKKAPGAKHLLGSLPTIPHHRGLTSAANLSAKNKHARERRRACFFGSPTNQTAPGEDRTVADEGWPPIAYGYNTFNHGFIEPSSCRRSIET